MKNSGFDKKGIMFRWLILICFLVIFLNVSYAAGKKRGAVLLMTTQNGQNIKGELLAVKEAKLILLDMVTSKGIEVEIDTIRHIRIVRRSQILKGIGKSLLIGAGSGFLLGFLDGDDSGGWFSMTAGEKALFGAVGFGILSLPVGGIWGAISGNDSSIPLETRSPEELQSILTKLNRRARFPKIFPGNMKSTLEPNSKKELRFNKKYNTTLNRIQERNSNQIASAKNYSRFHISYTPTYFHSNDSNNHSELFNKIGFSDTRPGGWILFFSYPARDYPRVQNPPKIKLKNFNIEFSLSKNIAIGVGYETIGHKETTGYKMIMLDQINRWGQQYYSDLFLINQYSGNMYYLTGSWKPIPDGFLERSSLELGIGVGISLIDLNYFASSYSFPESAENNFQAKKLGPLFIIFVEYDYYIGNNWSIGLKIDYKHAVTNIKSFQMIGNYKDLDEYDNLISSIMPINIPKHKINTGGIGFGFTLGLHF